MTGIVLIVDFQTDRNNCQVEHSRNASQKIEDMNWGFENPWDLDSWEEKSEDT